MADRLIKRAELASILAVSTDWTYRHLQRLIDEAGFPQPRLTNRWSVAAVEAWIAGQAARGNAANDDGAEARREARRARLQAL